MVIEITTADGKFGFIPYTKIDHFEVRYAYTNGTRPQLLGIIGNARTRGDGPQSFAICDLTEGVEDRQAVNVMTYLERCHGLKHPFGVVRQSGIMNSRGYEDAADENEE